LIGGLVRRCRTGVKSYEAGSPPLAPTVGAVTRGFFHV
jgi:hypothetical protein